MYNMLIPFLVLLGTFIPPFGGVIMADFWIRHRGKYPAIATVRLPNFNWLGLSAYFLGSVAAYLSPVLPPLIGIGVAASSYALLAAFFRSAAIELPEVAKAD